MRGVGIVGSGGGVCGVCLWGNFSGGGGQGGDCVFGGLRWVGVLLWWCVGVLCCGVLDGELADG